MFPTLNLNDAQFKDHLKYLALSSDIPIGSSQSLMITPLLEHRWTDLIYVIVGFQLKKPYARESFRRAQEYRGWTSNLLTTQLLLLPCLGIRGQFCLSSVSTKICVLKIYI